MNFSILLKSLSAGALVLLFAVPAAAQERPDIAGLLAQGQKAEALAKVDAYLQQRPDDPQARFQKGVILTELERRDDAIAVFSRLVSDYPEQPEFYNNLAVLYSATRQYELARAALESALRLRPDYATARENLGDVYAKLAVIAYDDAAKTNGGSPALAGKRAAIRSGVPAVGAPPVLAGYAPPPSRAAADKPAAPPSSNGDTRSLVLKTVEGWASAWSSRDTETYLRFYAADFKTPHRQSRRKWESKRREQLTSKSSISVKVESPEVAVNGDVATVKFHQVYVSNLYREDGSKTLRLAKQTDGGWKIVAEESAS